MSTNLPGLQALPPMPSAPPSMVELPQIVPAFVSGSPAASPGGRNTSNADIKIPAGSTPNHDARPPAMANLDHGSLPWLGDDMKDSVVSPPAQPIPRLDGVKLPPGIIRVGDGEDLFQVLDRLKLMYSMEPGSSCTGRIIDHGQMGVVETQGIIGFVKPGQWKLWSLYTQWSVPNRVRISDQFISVKGVQIVTLNQREVAAAIDQNGRSMLLTAGRFILLAPARLASEPGVPPQIISLVNMDKQKAVSRFMFFNVPQGEVAGITLTTGQVRILLPGVHIVEDCKFERFLPTVPIQSKLKKEVITSDMVTVSLEVDIATQLVDCARFLKMSAAQTLHAPEDDGADEKKSNRRGGRGPGAGANSQEPQSVGCKDLYDAIEESAQSHFVDTFGKTNYYNFRTRQGEAESKFEESALEVLDKEARKYGGRILKVNILKQRADAVEAVYAQHSARQVELEQKKQSQQRQYDIDESDQKHKQAMSERDEKGALLKQTLQQEREMAAKQHALRLNLQDAKAAQEKMDFEANAIAQRQKMEAVAQSESAKIRAQGAAEQQASQILIVAQAQAKAEELRGQAMAKAEEIKAKSRVQALSSLADVLRANPAMLELEKQRLHEELQVTKLQALVKSGARVVPVELMRLADVADERVLKRLENQAVLNVNGSTGSGGSSSTAMGVGAGTSGASSSLLGGGSMLDIGGGLSDITASMAAANAEVNSARNGSSSYNSSTYSNAKKKAKEKTASKWGGYTGSGGSDSSAPDAPAFD